MTERQTESGQEDPRVNAALDDYLQRIDRGEAVAVEDFLAEHAEIADELRSLLATSQELEELKRAAPSAPAEVSTRSIAEQSAETITPRRVQDPANAETFLQQLPDEFGRYRIVRPLGSGAMGAVYLAEDSQLHRQVALKTPSFDQDETGELLERFYREARSAASLRHPHICPVFDVGEINGRHYISMAYIEGQPLSAFIRADKLQPERQVLVVIRKLALALQDAHDQGIIHRDLKPGNVMIDGKGEPIVMDFGLARPVQSEAGARLTQSGMLVGSPAYMSPEQVEGDTSKLTPATDQYSLGIILYELLTGSLPYRGGVTAIIAAILTKEPAPPGDSRGDLDPRIEALCLKMMSKSPADRFPSMRAVADEIATILKSEPEQPTSKAKSTARSTPAPADAARKKKRKKARSAPAAAASITASNVESLLETAARCMRKHDYEQVVQMLDAIPENKRDEQVRALLDKARELSDEVAFLLSEIDEAVRLNDNEALARKADALLKLKPGHRKAQQIKEELKRYGPGRVWKAGGWTPDGKRIAEGSWIPWLPLSIFVGVFGVALLAVVLYLRVGDAVVRVQIKHPDVEVGIQNRTLNISSANQDIKIDPGEETLKVAFQGAEFETTKFTLNKGDNPAIIVELLDKTLSAKFGDELLGEWPVEPQVAKVTEQRLPPPVAESPADSEASPQVAASPAASDESGWIDVIPLIDPARDKFDFAWTGKNNWVVRNGELNIRPDKNAAKLLFPLVLDGPSLEWEISFTRKSGEKQFTTDIPSIRGGVPISVGWGTDQVLMGNDPSQKENISLGPCIVRNGQRTTVRIRVERENGQDHVEVFVDGKPIGEWTGDRETIAKVPQDDEKYRTDQRTGLYVGPRTAYTFHSIRLRMLEGEAHQLPQNVTVNAVWSRPETLNLNEPLSTSLTTLVHHTGSPPQRDLTMWTRTSSDADWSESAAVNPINTAADEASPCVSADGLTLVFESDRPGGLGQGDLWISTRTSAGGPWSAPVNLGENVNSPAAEGLATLSADGRTLIFASNRPDGRNGGSGNSKSDLWMSERSSRTSSDWAPAVNLGPAINSDARELAPLLSADGLELFFTSDRPGGRGKADLWVAHRAAVGEPWSNATNLGPSVNGSGWDYGHMLSPDGNTLLFSSDRPGARTARGQPELWVTRRGATASINVGESTTVNWSNLFNGRDLSGWRGLPDNWSWERGELIGTTTGVANFNTALCSQQSYRDFEIEFEVKLEGSDANSGLQIRSRILDADNFIVSGPQADMGGEYWGCLYGEQSGGMLQQADSSAVKHALRPNDYNHYAVSCIGKHVRITINGVQVLDGDFPTLPDEGILGWQLHRRRSMTARFRNIRIRELAPKSVDETAWTDLFNGRNLTGWQAFGGKAAWKARNGTLSCRSGQGWLATERQFTDFVLELEYKLPAGGNSGVFLRMPENADVSGGDYLEIQLFDDTLAGTKDWQRNGSIYGVSPPARDVAAPPNQWHQLRVRAEGPEIAVSLNGTEITRGNVETAKVLGPPRRFLKNKRGRIGLQRYKNPGNVEFRNIRVRELPSPQPGG